MIVANIWQSGFRCQTPSSAAWAEKRVQRSKEKHVDNFAYFLRVRVGKGVEDLD